MKRWKWMLPVAVLGAAALTLGVGRLAAQGARKPAGRMGVARNPAARAAAPLTPQSVTAKSVRAQAVLRGVLLILEYDPALSVDLDLDDNGGFLDNGDRALRQGFVWLADASGRKIREIGLFASTFDYLDVSGESTGTDVLQQVDLFLEGSGQIRAGGFWNVDDGVGDPALGINGATGHISARKYRQGQLVFLGTVRDNEELYFLAR